MEQGAMKQHGAFSWNELVTTDVASAKSFYKALLGWEWQDAPGDMAYALAKVKGQEVAGLVALPPEAESAGAPPAWGGYVTVDDVDKQAARAQQLGGKIIMPSRDIPNLGRFAIISDPQGAMLTLITYTS